MKIIVAVLTVLTLAASAHPSLRADIRRPSCGDRTYHVRIWNRTAAPVVVEVDLYQRGWTSATLVVPAGAHRMRRYPASVTTMELWSGRRFLASATSLHLGLTCHSA